MEPTGEPCVACGQALKPGAGRCRACRAWQPNAAWDRALYFGFAGLTAVGLVTRKDLSFLRPLLLWGGVVALVLIFAAVLFGLDLGVWFSVGMIGLAGAAILYQTQTILRSYPETAHVGAAVQLFASVMLLFWYVLSLLSRR